MKIYKCDICGKPIYQTNIWKKTCPECGKASHTTEKLLEHMKSMHEFDTLNSSKKEKVLSIEWIKIVIVKP